MGKILPEATPPSKWMDTVALTEVIVDSVVVSLFFHSNFQSSAMFEESESADTQEVKSDSTLGSSVSACKKVCVCVCVCATSCQC